MVTCVHGRTFLRALRIVQQVIDQVVKEFIPHSATFGCSNRQYKEKSCVSRRYERSEYLRGFLTIGVSEANGMRKKFLTEDWNESVGRVE